MFSFNPFKPDKPSPATLYDIENQYDELYEEDFEENKKDHITLKVKNLFGRV
jgi:hypothetical protein